MFNLSDMFDKEKRSEIMSSVKSTGNKSTEMLLINLFKLNGIKGWRRNYPLFGNPDFVFPKRKVAVFVDGEFWHGHPTRGQIPKTNTEFWKNKINKNRRRDREVNRTLKKRGWKIVRIWQHELKNNKWKNKIRFLIDGD